MLMLATQMQGLYQPGVAWALHPPCKPTRMLLDPLPYREYTIAWRCTNFKSSLACCTSTSALSLVLFSWKPSLALLKMYLWNDRSKNGVQQLLCGWDPQNVVGLQFQGKLMAGILGHCGQWASCSRCILPCKLSLTLLCCMS